MISIFFRQKSKIIQQDKRAFTLIEMMLSLAIIAIVTGAVISVARMSDTNKSLTLSAGEFKAALREAQTKALAGRTGEEPASVYVCGYGVKVVEGSADSYQGFYTYVNNETLMNNPKICIDRGGRVGGDNLIKETAINTLKLREGVKFEGDHSGAKVFFLSPYGEVNSFSRYNSSSDLSGMPVIFKLKGKNGGAVDVKVNQFGKIE